MTRNSLLEQSMTDDSCELLDTERSYYLHRNSRTLLPAEERQLHAQSIEDDLDEQEKSLLDFLNTSSEKMTKRLRQTFKEAKDINLMDKANKKLVK